MKKILITLLGQESDIICSSHFISSLKATYPKSKLSVLTFDKYSRLANLLTFVDEIHYINQTQLSSTLKSKIYSDAFALNSFFESIGSCLDSQWDMFFNYSNDLTSSYLATIVNANQKYGTSIAKTGNPLTNNIWASYQNFAMSKQVKHFLNRHLIRHEMLSINHASSNTRLKTDPELDKKAKRNFEKIKLNNSITAKRVIGINLEHSFHGGAFKENALSSLLEDIKLDETVEVVLLTQGTAKEIKTINSINAIFDNSIVSINAKPEALPSVIKNLDLLISLENSTLLVADALNIKTVEIKDKNFSQSSYLLNEGYALYSDDFSTIKNDLSFIINQELDTSLSVNKINSSNKTYLIVNDEYSLLESQINGQIQIENEIGYHLTRYYHLLLMGKDKSVDLIKHLKEAIPSAVMNDYLFKVKAEIDCSLKIILSAIRNVPLANSSKAHGQNLLKSLDQINERAIEDTITSAAFCLFESKLENLPSGNESQNIADIEKCLFELKSDIQVLISIIEDILGSSAQVHRRLEI